LLTAEEKQLLWEIYYEGLTEREIVRNQGIYHNAVHKKKVRILNKFEADMQPKVVQNIMGHQHYCTTIDIYTHISEAKYEEEINKFGMAMEEEVDIQGGNGRYRSG